MSINPLRFYHNVFEHYNEINNAFHLYAFRTSDNFHVHTTNGGMTLLDSEELIDIIIPMDRQINDDQLIQRLVIAEQRIANKIIEEAVSQKNKEEKTDYISDIVHKIDIYISKYDKGFISKVAFTPLKDSLKNLKAGLIEGYSPILPRALKTIQAKSKVNSSNKIQWMGRVAMLATLFHDLSKLKVPKSETPLINSEWKELALWLRDNFCDSEGKEFELSSLNTYLDPNPRKKKAKRNAIEVQFKD